MAATDSRGVAAGELTERLEKEGEFGIEVDGDGDVRKPRGCLVGVCKLS